MSLPTQTVRELLENPVQPINDMSYFGCLDSVMENSKVSGTGSSGGRDRNVALIPWCPGRDLTLLIPLFLRS